MKYELGVHPFTQCLLDRIDLAPLSAWRQTYAKAQAAKKARRARK